MSKITERKEKNKGWRWFLISLVTMLLSLAISKSSYVMLGVMVVLMIVVILVDKKDRKDRKEKEEQRRAKKASNSVL